jgi:uncharacterized membrane protein
MDIFQKKINYLWLLLLLFFGILMVRITIQYIPYNLDVGFLRIKQDYIHISLWRWAFFIHVYTSIFVLIAGFTQFSTTLLKRRKKLHRILGYIFSIIILFITGPSGLIMGFFANGGFYSRIAFVLLSVLWIYFTAMAVKKAIQKDFQSHQKFMMRSYALTLSAITLRAWKFTIMNLFTFPPMDVYRVVAWLGWGLNLLFVEWLIHYYYSKKE